MLNDKECAQKNLSLDTLRADLAFQLQSPEDLDWDYFLETAVKAKVVSDRMGLNRPESPRSILIITSDGILGAY